MSHNVDPPGTYDYQHRYQPDDDKQDAVDSICYERRAACAVNTRMTTSQVDVSKDLSFYANFRAALDLAANSATMNNPEARQASTMQAINRFLEAEHHYTNLADIEITNQSQVTDDYLATLCLAYVTEVWCYLELDELETAIQRLQDGLSAIKPRFEKHVRTLLTSNPAAYLHPVLNDQISLQRLTRVFRWLSPDTDEVQVFENQRENLFNLANAPQAWLDSLPPAIRLPVKSRFFNPQLLVDFAEQFDKRRWAKGFKGLMNKLPTKVAEARSPREKTFARAATDPILRLPETLEIIESMMEDCSRFEIYLAELQTIKASGMTFQEWRRLTPRDGASQPASDLLYITVPAVH